MRPFLPSVATQKPGKLLPSLQNTTWFGQTLPLGSGQPLQMPLHHRTSCPALICGSHASKEQALLTSPPTMWSILLTSSKRHKQAVVVANVSEWLCLCSSLASGVVSLFSEPCNSPFLWDHVKQLKNLEKPVLSEHFMVSVRIDFLNDRNFSPKRKHLVCQAKEQKKKKDEK